MATTIKIDPVTRLEGHLNVEVTIDTVNSVQQVLSSPAPKSSGAMFRGFENMLINRDPRDAVHLTQRICGVCPVSHGMAACMNLEKAFGITNSVPDNGRVMRNLVLGANFIQSHILHFYHLAALDYINTDGILDMPPWSPRYVTPDMVGGDTAKGLVSHYVKALEMRRKAHQMGAIFGGKLPHPPTFVVGGCTSVPSADDITNFRALLDDLITFIDTTYQDDVNAVATVFSQYYNIGRGWGNLLAYGVFDQDFAGINKLLKRGRYYGGTKYFDVDPINITEYVNYSWYSSTSGNLNPSAGLTQPDAYKAGAYSWIKAPDYLNKRYEVGPLARMVVNGDYTSTTMVSVMDRIAARFAECQKVAYAMDTWLDELSLGSTGYFYSGEPLNATAYGLTEAPRGALGHWITITNAAISRYQVVTPTAWNCSPKDTIGQLGALEKALVGTPVADITKPVEILRVIHSFDPCLSCSVHMVRPDSKAKPVVIDVRGAAI